MCLHEGLCSRANLSEVDVAEELANVDVNGTCIHISESGRSRCRREKVIVEIRLKEVN